MNNASPVFKTALPAIKIALLGAESTGKTLLAHSLAAHLRQAGAQAIAVDEYLREWCEQKGRTPQPQEQAEIALRQRLRIEQAARDLASAAAPDQPSYVIADTTPLMTATYSEFIFSDNSLTPAALTYQRSFHLTLLTGLDMPWQADGIQRDGAHVRVPVDALLRERMQSGRIAFEVIYGLDEQRLQAAIKALFKTLDTINSIAPRAMNTPTTAQNSSKNASENEAKAWVWVCDKCSDPECEHQLFTRLSQQAAR
jgi:nicotinamide riboside kinase